MPISRESRIARRDASVQRWATLSPARCTTASRPVSAAAGRGLVQRPPGVGLDVAEGGARALGIAREHRDGVAARLQRAHDPRLR